MSRYDLLPPNATQLERDFSRATSFLERIGPPVPTIRTAKRVNIPDSVVPWLIYEYGLGELLPYLSDQRRAIAEGVLWQRIRGTPGSLKVALRWIGLDAFLEESEAGTLRWAEYQLGLERAPNGLTQIGRLVGIARISQPVRSRLFRVYGGYDHRRFRLDDHQLSGGSWLCDDTGVYLQEGWPQLSFGRQYSSSANITADAAFELGIERARADGGVYEDRNILSVSQLDELVWEPWHMAAETVTVSRGHFSVAGPWWQPSYGWGSYSWDQGIDWAGLANRIAPPLQFAKAGIYLSDGAVLDDTNACFSARFEAEVGFGALLLSEGDQATGEGLLSEHLSRLEYVEHLERLERAHTSSGADPHNPSGFLAAHDRLTQRELPYDDTFTLSQHRLDEFWHATDEQAITRAHTDVGYGQGVTALTWESVRWIDANNWLTLGARESQLSRVHTTEVTENRQGVAEIARLGTHVTAVDFTLFGSWLTRTTWVGYWNESAPLITSEHQSST